MTFTNAAADMALQGCIACENIGGKIGYAVAKNRRKLEAELTEYTKIKNDALRKYGKEYEPGRIGIDGKRDPQAAILFQKALEPYAGLTIDVDIMMVDEPTETEFVELGLTPRLINGIRFMIREPEAEEEPAKETEEETQEIAEVKD